MESKIVPVTPREGTDDMKNWKKAGSRMGGDS